MLKKRKETLTKKCLACKMGFTTYYDSDKTCSKSCADVYKNIEANERWEKRIYRKNRGRLEEFKAKK